MKLFLTIVATVFTLLQASSQYYYNDIVILKETNRQYQAIKAARINSITAQSFESTNEPTANFLVQQSVGSGAAQITTTSDIPSAGHSVSINYYSNNLLAKTVDNAVNIESTVTYTYDAAGNVQNITTVTTDTFMATSTEEVHLWFYDGNTPTRMLRIKDKVDTTVVNFVKDDQGNIGEEHWKKKGRRVEDYFYYYNNSHLVTDVVRFNNLARKMLPDYLFEYDDAGKVTQFTQILQSTSSYLVWHYEYNSNGLKQKETCFDKQKQLAGHIEYTYR